MRVISNNYSTTSRVELLACSVLHKWGKTEHAATPAVSVIRTNGSNTTHTMHLDLTLLLCVCSVFDRNT